MLPSDTKHRCYLSLQAMNYHKYVSIPTPHRRSDVASSVSLPVVIAVSSVQQDANTISSSFIPVQVLGDITPAEGAMVSHTPEPTTVSDTPRPITNGIKNEANASSSTSARDLHTNGVVSEVANASSTSAADLQTNGVASEEVLKPTADAVPTASQTPGKRQRGRPRKVRSETETAPVSGNSTRTSESIEQSLTIAQRLNVIISDAKKKKKTKWKAKPRKKSMFRRPLTGELGQRLYTMPPLPPTATSLGAFKSLLLDRLRLLRTAGVFHVDSVLGVPKELEQELNPEATGSAVTSETRDAATTSGANGTSTGASGSSKEPRAGARVAAQDSDNAGKKYSCPPILRSRLHADHWMKMIRNTHDYQMLRSRFMSLFLWPALLSSVRVEDPNGDASQQASKRLATVASLLGSGRLVVDPNEPDDEEKTEEQPVATGHKVWSFVRPQYR